MIPNGADPSAAVARIETLSPKRMYPVTGRPQSSNSMPRRSAIQLEPISR
jgi:hypothetical protein